MTSENERWLPIPGFDGYDVSTLGRVRSWRKKGRVPGRRTEPLLMKLGMNNGGYLHVNLRTANRSSIEPVHLLVLLTFAGPRPEGLQGAHADGDRHNNRSSNLAWVTPHENARQKLNVSAEIRARMKLLPSRGGPSSGGVEGPRTTSALLLRVPPDVPDLLTTLAAAHGETKAACVARLIRAELRPVEDKATT